MEIIYPPLSPSQRVREAMMSMESPPRSLAETIAAHDALLSYIPSSSATQSPPVHDSSQQNDPVVLTSDQSSLMVGSDPSSPLSSQQNDPVVLTSDQSSLMVGIDPSSPLSAGDSSTSLPSAVLTPSPIQSLSALLSAPLPLYDNRVINQSGDNLSLQVTSLDIAMQPWLSNLSPHMNSDPMSPISTAQPSIVCSTPVGANYQDDSLSPSPTHVDDPVIYDTQTRQLFQDAEATLDLLRSNTTLIPPVMHASPSVPIPIRSSLSSLVSQHSTIHHDIATPEVYTPTSQVPSPMSSVDSCEPSTQVTYDTKTRELLWEADATLDLLMAPLSPVRCNSPVCMYSLVSIITTHAPLSACLIVRVLSCLNVASARLSFLVKLSVVVTLSIWSIWLCADVSCSSMSRQVGAGVYLGLVVGGCWFVVLFFGSLLLRSKREGREFVKREY